MAFNDIEKKRYERIVDAYVQKRRPPPHLRKEVDLLSRVYNQSVEIYEIRPAWDDPSDLIEIPVAKTTFVKSQDEWKLFWQRRDLKWHLYEPDGFHDSLDEVLEVIDRDEYGCFFG